MQNCSLSCDLKWVICSHEAEALHGNTNCFCFAEGRVRDFDEPTACFEEHVHCLVVLILGDGELECLVDIA